MKLRATINIEFDACDAIDAQRQKREIAERVNALAGESESVKLTFTERRPRDRPRAPAPLRVHQ